MGWKPTLKSDQQKRFKYSTNKCILQSELFPLNRPYISNYYYEQHTIFLRSLNTFEHVTLFCQNYISQFGSRAFVHLPLWISFIWISLLVATKALHYNYCFGNSLSKQLRSLTKVIKSSLTKMITSFTSFLIKIL